MSRRKKTTQSMSIPGQNKQTRLSKALGSASLTRPESKTPAPAYFDFDPAAANVPPPAPMLDSAPPALPDTNTVSPPTPATPAVVEFEMPERPPAATLILERLSFIPQETPAITPGVELANTATPDVAPATDFTPQTNSTVASDVAPAADLAPRARRKTRMTLVQEFDITKLVAETETQSQKVIPIETVDDFNSAMHYFTGQAEARTYTAELRFRASFTPIQEMKVTSEPEALPAQGDSIDSTGASWIVADDCFSQAASEQAKPVANSGFSMLDLIDEGYRTLQANPTFTQSRQAASGLAIDYSQPIAKLPPVSTGLMGGVSGGTKGSGAQYKGHWSKR